MPVLNKQNTFMREKSDGKLAKYVAEIGSNSQVIDYLYQNGNLMKETYMYTYEDGETFEAIFEYKYDNKKTPMYNRRLKHEQCKIFSSEVFVYDNNPDEITFNS